MFQRGGKRTMGGGSSLSFRRGVYKAWFRQTRLSGGGKGCRRFVNRGVGINFAVCGGWGWCYAFLEVFCRFRNWITSRAMTKHVLTLVLSGLRWKGRGSIARIAIQDVLYQNRSCILFVYSVLFYFISFVIVTSCYVIVTAVLRRRYQTSHVISTPRSARNDRKNEQGLVKH